MVRHDGEPLLRSYAVTHPSGQVVLPQPEGWDQLLFASTGSMTVRTPEASWLVPPHRAVWAPSGVSHRLLTEGRVQVRTLYLRAGTIADAGPCRAVELTPFVRELVLHLVALAPIWPADRKGRRLVEVLADELGHMPDSLLRLPRPTDARAAHVAAALADPSEWDRPIDELAVEAGAARRTVERLFVAETGMSVGRWRAQARLVAAVKLMAAGVPVTRVAVEVGYSTPSSFGAAFRQVLGTSPGRYLSTRHDRQLGDATFPGSRP